MRFWDSSAVVPLLVTIEPSRDALLRLLDDDPEMVVWWGCAIECTSAVTRRERDGAMSGADAAKAFHRLRELSLEWQEIVPSEPLRTLAQRLLRVHPLRAGDSQQLAAATIAAERESLTLEFVSLDDRLNDAAQREGFRVISA